MTTPRLALLAAVLVAAITHADTASSLKKLILYDRENFKGRAKTFMGSYSDLRRAGFNDKAESAIVYGAPWETYEHINYKGVKRTLAVGRHAHLKKEGFVNKISSLKPSSASSVPTKKLILYDRENFKGHAKAFMGSYSDLRRAGFNDKAESAIVYGAPWETYEHINYKGVKRTLAVGRHAHLKKEGFVNKISSLKPSSASSVPSKPKPVPVKKLILYDRENFKGRAKTFMGSYSDLRRAGFNDKAESAIVYGAPWETYEHINYKGVKRTLAVGRHAHLKKEGFVNKISSLKPSSASSVPSKPKPAPAKKLILYDRENFKGHAKAFMGSYSDLRRAGFNDKAESAIVYGAPWETYEHINYKGVKRTLAVGRHAHLKKEGFVNKISSLKPSSASSVPSCRTGFKRRGSSCVDVNECTEVRSACKTGAKCINALGSFSCKCDGDKVYNSYKGCVDPPSPMTGCNSKADIVFVVDASGSVGSSNFNTVRRFIKDVVGQFAISSDKTRIGIIKYSSKSTVEVKLNQGKSRDDVFRAVDKMKYTGGRTNTGSALKDLYSKLRSASYGRRKDVPLVAIVMTDGRSNSPTDTIRQAGYSKKYGIKLFSIGIGKNLYTKELDAIASSPTSEHRFLVQTFASLSKIYVQIAQQTCKDVCKSGDCVNCKTGFTNVNGKCFSGKVLVLFDHKGFKGKETVITAANPDLRKLGFNDKAESAIVIDAPWKVYEHVGYKGKYKTLTVGKHADLVKERFGNYISSVKLSDAQPTPRKALVLFDSKNFKGTKKVFTGDYRDLRSLGFNDKAESAMVYGAPWKVYEHVGYKGKYRTLTVGKHADLKKNGKSFNNFISSVKLADSSVDNSASCKCSASGDPHYRTYDGQMIHFMGQCKYILSKSLIPGDACAFVVEVKNEKRVKSKPVAHTRMVDFKINGQTIRLLKGKRVQVNDETRSLPITLLGGKIKVGLSGKNVKVSTACGITVTFDGNHKATVETPGKYRGKLTGICGDCNGKKDDFRTSKGVDVSRQPKKAMYAAIGNSYVVPDDSDMPSNKCEVPQKTPTPGTDCPASSAGQIAGSSMCGLITNVKTLFAACIKGAKLDLSGFVDSCKYDVCSAWADADQRKDVLCENLENFADACAEKNFPVKWRSEKLCPMACGKNMRYNPSACATPATCISDASCNGPRVEACECIPGYVLSGTECVPRTKCGCVSGSIYRKIGEQWVSRDCRTLNKCTADSRGRSRVTSTRAQSCHRYAHCALYQGTRQCVCNKGFSGDGLDKCDKIPEPPPPAPKVILYKEKNFQGEEVVVTKDAPNLSLLSSKMNDQAQSVKVIGKLPIYLYNDDNYKGRYALLRQGEYRDLPARRISTKVSSVKFYKPPSRMILYKSQGLRGSYKILSTSVPDLRSSRYRFNDLTRSIRITGNDEWLLYGDINYKKYLRTLKPGEYKTLPASQDKKISSVRLFVCKPGYKKSGSSCVDIDECKENKNVCKSPATCRNTAGSYVCECPNGYAFMREEGCKKLPTLPNGCNGKADIIFVLDSSGSVGATNFRTMKAFVRNFLKQFKIGDNGLRVGMVSFSTRSQIRWFLNRYRDMNSLLSAVDKIPYTPGGTYTHLALRHIANMFNVRYGMRMDVPHIAVMLTDGRSTHKSLTMLYAKGLKRSVARIQTYTVGIGKNLDTDELKAIASEPEDKHVFRAADFSMLNAIYMNLAVQTCSDVSGKTCPSGQMYDEKKKRCVNPGNMLILYDQPSFGGKEKQFTSANPNFPKIGFNDKARSAVVYGKPWKVYQHAKFGGRARTLPAGRYADLRKYGFDRYISSVKPADDTADQRSCKCSASGDPHYRTYDSQMIHFMGQCKYTLSKSLIPGDACAFAVEVKNERRVKSRPVAHTRMVDFKINGQTIRLLKGKRVQVNGETKTLPISLLDGKIKVGISGKNVKVSTACGITVTFDGNHKATVETPGKYRGKLTGICGDCNGKKDDFRTSKGVDVSRQPAKAMYAAIGNSYVVPDDSDKPSNKCEVPQSEPTPGKDCPLSSASQIAGSTMCGLITSTAMSPFADCIKSGKVDLPGFVASCKYDVCSAWADPDQRSDVLCENLENFADACYDKGFKFQWRKANFCPLSCGKDMVYTTSASACPATCVNPTPDPSKCGDSPGEGCVCKPGYVLSGTECVPLSKCGCSYRGEYRALGEEWISSTCTTVYRCAADRAGKPRVTTTAAKRCHRYARCALVRGTRKCVCKTGFSGDGIDTCNSDRPQPPKLTLYSDQAFRGRSFTVRSSLPDLRRYRFSDVPRSIRVEGSDEWIAYRDINYKSPYKTLPTLKPGDYKTLPKDIDRTISSLRILKCAEGERKQGSTCVDIDECKEKKDLCPSPSVCKNLPGSYQCVCPDGYVFMGQAGCQKLPSLGSGCGGKADIVFVLDSSGSVSRQNYKIMKNFVHNFLKQFDIGDNGLRVGAIVFSSRSYIRFYLNKYKDQKSLLQAVDSLPYISGGTYTDKALQHLRSMFNTRYGMRPGVPHIGVVLTDGRSTHKSRTMAAALAVHRAKIKTFAVGIGNRLAMDELQRIATDPDSKHLFRVDDFSKLNALYMDVAIQTCNDVSGGKGPQCEEGLVYNSDKGCVKPGTVPVKPTPTPEPDEGLFLYEHESMKGKSVIIKDKVPDLRLPPFRFNDLASSAVVKGRYSYMLYRDANYRTPVRMLRPGMYSRFTPMRINDVVSSVKRVGGPVTNEIILYEKEKFQGKAKKINSDQPNLDDLDFDDTTESIEVKGTRTWELFDEKNYEKSITYLRPGRYPYARQIGGKDRLTSVRLYTPKPPVVNQVELYSTEQCSGAKRVIRTSVSDLRRLSFYKLAKCVIVKGKLSWDVFRSIRYQSKIRTLKPGRYTGKDISRLIASLRFTPPPFVVKCQDRSASLCARYARMGYCTKSEKAATMFLMCRKTCSRDQCGSCPEGFMYNKETKDCIDINECATNTSACRSGASCINTPGGYRCTCRTGYQYHPTKGCFIDRPQDYSVLTCRDFTTSATCSRLARAGYCRSSIPSRRNTALLMCRKSCNLCSQCPTGYQLMPDRKSCKDIDECATGKAKCAANSNCRNTNGNFVCTCNSGYTGNGRIKCYPLPTRNPQTTTVPETSQPATEPPTTYPPSTEPPTTYPPSTEPPTTYPPSTEPPTTYPPTTEPTTEPTTVIVGDTWEMIYGSTTTTPEPTTEPSTVPPTEPPTPEPPTEPTTEPTTVPPTEPSTPEPPTEPTTEPTTVPPTEPSTPEPPTEPTTEPTTTVGPPAPPQLPDRPPMFDSVPLNDVPSEPVQPETPTNPESNPEGPGGIPGLPGSPMFDTPGAPAPPTTPDEPADDADNAYFITEPAPQPKPKPKPLGMASGVIKDPYITATSFAPGFDPTKARPLSNGAWKPNSTDDSPCLQIDLQKVLEIHGIGTIGHPEDGLKCWVEKYGVEYSIDNVNYTRLGLNTSLETARVFEGNNDGNTWKRHCLHRYYGHPISARYIRFCPIESGGCMRAELYGFRAADDPDLLDVLQNDVFTKNTTGCPCYFNPARTDCACCRADGCQCSSSNHHQCVQCGSNHLCGIPETVNPGTTGEDAWTQSPTGCKCSFDPSRTDCACCKRYGCQCGAQNRNQCVNCGSLDSCGTREDVFGPNAYCVPKTCPSP